MQSLIDNLAEALNRTAASLNACLESLPAGVPQWMQDSARQDLASAYAAAKSVIDGDEPQGALRDAIVAAADKLHVDGKTEFSGNPALSWSDSHAAKGGTYVQSWTWVPCREALAEHLPAVTLAEAIQSAGSKSQSERAWKLLDQCSEADTPNGQDAALSELRDLYLSAVFVRAMHSRALSSTFRVQFPAPMPAKGQETPAWKPKIVSRQTRRRVAYSWIAASAAITLIMILTTIVGAMVSAMAWHPEYNRAVHGHMENAYYANTPELMIRELKEARTGMVELGLEPSLYSSLKPWEHTPDNRMDYQYAHIDSIIERAEAVAADRQRQQSAGTSDQLGDVFEEKMDNLRAFIKEDGWSDDIALAAYFSLHHTAWAAYWQFSGFIFAAWVLLAALPPVIAVVTLDSGWAESVKYRGGRRVDSSMGWSDGFDE